MAKTLLSKTLPSDFEKMEKYIVQNRFQLSEQVVSSIEYAIKNNLSTIEVFNFEHTDFIIILNDVTFKENLDNIYKYYISIEKYECCGRVLKLQEVINQEKTNEQKKRYKPENLTRFKNKRHDRH